MTIWLVESDTPADYGLELEHIEDGSHDRALARARAACDDQRLVARGGVDGSPLGRGQLDAGSLLERCQGGRDVDWPQRVRSLRQAVQQCGREFR